MSRSAGGGQGPRSGRRGADGIARVALLGGVDPSFEGDAVHGGTRSYASVNVPPFSAFSTSSAGGSNRSP
jgi:hypothetical protein